MELIHVIDGDQVYYTCFDGTVEAFKFPLQNSIEDLKKEVSEHIDRMKNKYGDLGIAMEIEFEGFFDSMPLTWTMEEVQERNMASDYPIELRKLPEGVISFTDHFRNKRR